MNERITRKKSAVTIVPLRKVFYGAGTLKEISTAIAAVYTNESMVNQDL
jgi:hypothetical protein